MNIYDERVNTVIIIQCSPFITHLLITQILIQHCHVVGPFVLQSWNFTKELLENDHEIPIIH